MKPIYFAAALAFYANMASATPVDYTLDPSHSQVVFSYQHLGFSTTYGMFSGFGGKIVFDPENPEASEVSVSMPVRSMMTGWQARFEQFMTDDFFGAGEADMITFTSTGIEVTGEDTAHITGDLTLHGMTKSVVLVAVLNKAGQHPMKDGQEWAGFSATTTLLRSDYGLDLFAPFVSNEVEVRISIEAGKTE